MGKKINYNKKTKDNKLNKNLKMAVIAIFSLIILLILIKSIKNVKDSLPNDIHNNDEAKVYYSVEEYETLEEVIKSYNCRFISKEESSNFVKVYLGFDVDLYTGNISNETHFLNMARVIAEFLKYKNFELVDTNKNIDIEVKCEEPNIVEFKINGDINYYLNHNSKINKKLSTTTTNFTIQSPELQELINGNWNESTVNWGTKDSNCNGYNIFFEEGIKYKNVARNVFNVVFTSKYNAQVAGGLTPTSSLEDVENALGTPTFSYNSSMYGYVSESCYLFFDFSNKEISVYPVVKSSREDEGKLNEYIKEMNETSDIKAFATNLTDLWNDYDVYSYDSNYVDLRYTLRGIQLSINSRSLNNGIYIYQNYSGDRNIERLDNVYIKDSDFVFDEDKSRLNGEMLSRIDQGDFSEEDFKTRLGVDFSIRFRRIDNNKQTGPLFYSRDESYPDSELDRNLEMSSHIWYDDYKIIYSVDGDGIYVYNCRTRVNVKIAEIEGEITINSAENGQIIYNDTEVLNVVIN